MRTVRIGSGAGFSGDRIDPAVELASKGGISYLIFECLAERTIALAQQRKRKDPSQGYDPLLAERMEAVLPLCREKGIKIITNMGAANPVAAAVLTRQIVQGMGLKGLRIAAVTGDDVLDLMRNSAPTLEDDGPSLESIGDRIVSANAYLGVDSILEALSEGADMVITGRVADPSLFLAPLIHEFDWPLDHWPLLGQGTVIGHLLECAGQVSGGYFADPGYKDVPNLAWLGFPLAEVSPDGSATITKAEGSGGLITQVTGKEQLLYEIQDPTAYLTPDVVADFSNVEIRDAGYDRIHVSGGSGRARPGTLKTSVGYFDGYQGEGQISYAGPGALARARLAREILETRLATSAFQELRFDFIGCDAIHGTPLSRMAGEPYEVRLRVAGKADTLKQASIIPREVEGLYTNGPAGGGGVTTSTKETIAMLAMLVPRELVAYQIHFEVS
jgi:hypothetical protein